MPEPQLKKLVVSLDWVKFLLVFLIKITIVRYRYTEYL
jgi:hypothetical protein